MQLSKEELSSRFDAAQVAYKRKIRAIAYINHKHLPGFDPQDVEQELLVVLWRCVIQYDPNKGATFNTLFTASARNRLASMVRHITAQRRTAVVTSLEEESVQAAINEVLSSPSAEDTALLEMRIKEMMAKGGAPGRGEESSVGRPSRRGSGSKHRGCKVAKVS